MRVTSFRGFHLTALRAAGFFFLAIGLAWPAGDALAYERDQAFYDYFQNWFVRVDKTQEAQPHWMTPIVTTTPRLEQEIRYDINWIKTEGGKALYRINYGAGKGLELIPTENTELIVSIPAYNVVQYPGGAKLPPAGTGPETNGLQDLSFLLKYRFLAANEEHGNYILTGFLGATAPTGVNRCAGCTTHTSVITPTLAAGKGWGTRTEGFDIQSTLGWAIPAAHETQLGSNIAWNTAFQVYAFKYIWTEVEFTYIHYVDGYLAPAPLGPNKNAWLMSPGIIFGRFPLLDRIRAVVGLSYQTPISTFRSEDHAWLLSMRFPF